MYTNPREHSPAETLRGLARKTHPRAHSGCTGWLRVTQPQQAAPGPHLCAHIPCPPVGLFSPLPALLLMPLRSSQPGSCKQAMTTPWDPHHGREKTGGCRCTKVLAAQPEMVREGFLEEAPEGMISEGSDYFNEAWSGSFSTAYENNSNGQQHRSCHAPWLTLCQPLHPSSHSTLSAPLKSSAITTTICRGRNRGRERSWGKTGGTDPKACVQALVVIFLAVGVSQAAVTV